MERLQQTDDEQIHKLVSENLPARLTALPEPIMHEALLKFVQKVRHINKG